jgi:formate hydrogenlyase subunit 3/multisubunit Na+/H+ antiporter MnhD subunit
MGGIWRRLPATMTAFAVGSAGLVGFPGVAGFVSKWHLVLGAFDRGALAFAAAFLLAGVLKLLFFWPVLLTAYAGDDATEGFRPVGAHGGDAAAARSPDGWERRTPATESTWRLLGPILVTAAAAVVFGILPEATPFWELARAAATEVVAGG